MPLSDKPTYQALSCTGISGQSKSWTTSEDLAALWENEERGVRKTDMNDRLLLILLSFGAGIALAAFSALYIAKPDEVACYARTRYLERNRLLQKWPFSKMVMKPWYPSYLRVMGIIILGFALMSLGTALYETAILFSK